MALKRCPICKKQYKHIDDLCNHLESKHSDVLDGMSGGKYYFYARTGRVNGKCIVCGGDTDFNEVTKKPGRFCNNPDCKQKYRDMFKKRMMQKYGTDCLLNDPEVQKKMLMNRGIAKQYKWHDGGISTCIGSYEYDFAQFCDIFLGFKSKDVMFPAPQIFEYQYDDDKHFWIPDAYIPSLNLIIEIKDGGTNPNTHPKIQGVDKVKEKLKDDIMINNDQFNYIKITDKKYGEFVNMLIRLKDQDYKNEKPEIVINEVMMETLKKDILHECVINNEVKEELYLINYNGIPLMNINNKFVMYNEDNGMIKEVKLNPELLYEMDIIQVDMEVSKVKRLMEMDMRKVSKVSNTPNIQLDEFNYPIQLFNSVNSTKHNVMMESFNDYIELCNTDKFSLIQKINNDTSLSEQVNFNVLLEDIDDEYINYLTEEKLSSKERKDLKNSDFGVPELRKFPLIDKQHVVKAIQYFKYCPDEYKSELAKRISKKCKKFDIELKSEKVKEYLTEQQCIIFSQEDILKEATNVYNNILKDTKFMTMKNRNIVNSIMESTNINELEIASVIAHNENLINDDINTLLSYKEVLFK